MPLPPEELRQLGAVFRRRGMLAHVRALTRRELEPGLAAEWLRYLRIPPHQDDYPVLPRGAPCPRCGSMSPDRTATG